jgi:hypothetical protein
MLESQKQSLEVALSVLSVEIPGENKQNNNEEQTEPTTSAVEGTEKPQVLEEL